MAAVSYKTMEWDCIEDMILGLTPEIARKKRQMMENELKEETRIENLENESKGCMLSTPTASQLSSTAILLIRTKTGHERRAWHDWAEKNGFKHHFAVNTKHFSEQGVWYCSWCNTAHYAGSEVKSCIDYDMNGHPCGSWKICPTPVEDSEDEMATCSNVNLVWRPAVNAICLTNNDTIKHPRRKKQRKLSSRDPPKLTVAELPFRKTHVMDHPDIEF